MFGLRLGFVLPLLVFVGCKQNGTTTPCVNMTGQSELVKDAAALRVDIYDGSVACTAIATATPQSSKLFAKGQTIELTVKPGSRTIVLTAYSDAAGTMAIGRACTTANLGKGDNACFDLVVDAVNPVDMASSDLASSGDDLMMPEAPDLAIPDSGTEEDMAVVAEPDLTPPADLVEQDLVAPADLKPQCSNDSVDDCPVNTLCCNNLCVPNNTASNCGSCGAICGTQHTKSSSCATGTCVLECNDGFADCNTDKADGCEIDLNTNPDHCGACTRACSSTQTASRHCSNGVCDSTCNTGFANCAKPSAAGADNGCECAGNGCCGAGGDTCQSPHNTGTGQTWYNCTATSTTNFTQANLSCEAYAGSAGGCTDHPACGGDSDDKAVCNESKNGAYGCCCFWYLADGDENGNEGRVRCSGINGGTGVPFDCASSCEGNARNQDWN